MSQYTLEMSVFRIHCIIYSDCANYIWFQPNFGHIFCNVKHKPRRPLNTLILEEGVVDSLIKDVVDFLKMEDWYIEAGIPHRRGYLLHGPPGVGKSNIAFTSDRFLNHG